MRNQPKVGHRRFPIKAEAEIQTKTALTAARNDTLVPKLPLIFVYVWLCHQLTVDDEVDMAVSAS